MSNIKLIEKECYVYNERLKPKVKLKGYLVEGLNPDIYKGLNIFIHQYEHGYWQAYETATGYRIDLQRNYTMRDPINTTYINCLNYLAKQCKKWDDDDWAEIQKHIPYPLKIEKGKRVEPTINAFTATQLNFL